MTLITHFQSNVPLSCYLLLFCLGGTLTGGCDGESNGLVLSLQPSYASTDLQTDKDLTGTWITEDGDLKMRFEEEEDKVYKLTEIEIDGQIERSGSFDVHLIRLGSSWFADFLPTGDIPADSAFAQMHFLRAHTIARVDLSHDDLGLAFLSDTWLKKKIKEQTVDIPHREIEGTLLLTGTTEEFQDLIYLHSDDDAAFAEEINFHRQEEEDQ